MRRRGLVGSADVIRAAGESSQTDPSAFIAQQRQLLNEARLSREKDQQEENSQRQLSEMEQRVKRMEEQPRAKDRELENSERLSSESQRHSRNVQTQLREKELQEASMHEQLREKGQQEQNSQIQLRGIQQQLKEKDEQEKNLQRQLRELEQQLRKKDEQGENLQDRLRVMEQRLRKGEDKKKNLQRQFRGMEQQFINLQGQFRDKQDETANLKEQVTTLERQLRVKDRQVNELEITLSTAQQTAQHQRRQVTPDWVISRDKIQLTDKLLGRGGWGSVVEGKYCGCSVAVKQIHELILSPHNRNLFEREMNIDSRCRHPCLLQFIGATNGEGSPFYVTELMESSLRALLGQRPLAATEVSIISLDVARALNYLHQKTPPIIHRDISSANVLLWRQGDQWRGKVSDYGTANFMQHTMTVGPGAMIYMAPEALTSNQTVKVSYDLLKICYLSVK